MMKKCSVAEAARLLKEGKLVAFPTETVYGIGAQLYNVAAVQELYAIKKRSPSKPFSAHIHSIKQAEELADHLPDLFYKLAELFLPGPLTIIVKRKSQIPAISVGGATTIGIRIPANDIAQELLRLVDEPLVATSANFSSEPPAISAEELAPFATLIAAVVDGGVTALQMSSTVVSIDEENRLHLLRKGAISKNQLEQVCQIC